MFVEKGAAFCVGSIVGIGHVRKQKIEEDRLVVVNKLTVGIAPLAIIFVEFTAGFTADHGIFAERHSAALAEELARSAEQRVDGHVEFTGDDFEHFGIRLGFASFLAAHSLARYMQAFCHLVLGQVLIRAQLKQNVSYFHNILLLQIKYF